jgi:hypothetical protein
VQTPPPTATPFAMTTSLSNAEELPTSWPSAATPSGALPSPTAGAASSAPTASDMESHRKRMLALPLQLTPEQLASLGGGWDISEVRD